MPDSSMIFTVLFTLQKSLFATAAEVVCKQTVYHIPSLVTMTQYLPIMKTKETLMPLNIFLVLSSASILAPCYSMGKLSLPPPTSNISCNLTHALLNTVQPCDCTRLCCYDSY